MGKKFSEVSSAETKQLIDTKQNAKTTAMISRVVLSF